MTANVTRVPYQKVIEETIETEKDQTVISPLVDRPIRGILYTSQTI